MKSRVYVVIPTLNAAGEWERFSQALLEDVFPDHVLIIDSSSTDGTKDLARTVGFEVREIERSQFDHGGTRQLGVDLLPDADILVFLTQDAILAEAGAIDELLAAFRNPAVGAAFGRQLPRREAEPIEAHARLFNYGTKADVRTLADRQRLGFKSIFISNSFAAFRRDALVAVGGFPKHVIFGEDTVVAAKLLLSGWSIAYQAEARVYHSHSYTVVQEFKRYFDVGVLHSKESWLREMFGEASGEGMRFVRSELSYLWKVDKFLIPSAVVRTGAKWIGYRLGRIESRLSIGLKRKLSMHSGFWCRSEKGI